MASTAISFGVDNYGNQIGINHGPIWIASVERPETPPSPLSTVPFPHDPDFVHRKTLIERIHNECSIPGSRVALVGLGGVGKSQLAIEYTHQVRSKMPATWIFWVHASNEARFEQSFRAIADQLRLPGRQDPGSNIFQLVENWLWDERKGRWICILDNVDDEFLCSIPKSARKHDSANGLRNAPTKPLIEYVPRSPNGSTIVTSRSRKIALRIVDSKNLIEVEPMEKSEALELFQKKLGQQQDSQEKDSRESQELVAMLEFMPLAIVQAASFIQNRSPRYSITQYLNDFQKSDKEAIELLTNEVGHMSRDWEAKNSILVTWQISFEYIKQERPSAADMLSLMSFFDRQGIPEYLVRHQPPDNAISSAELGGGDFSDSESSIPDICADFESDVAILRAFSFISVSEDRTSFTMHRLIQLSTRAWLKAYSEEEQWREKFIKNLAKEFPSGDYGTWEKCRVLYPHTKSAMAQRPKSQEYQVELSGLLYKGAQFALGMGLFDDMEKMASKSKKWRVKVLGPRNEMALESIAMLAIAYRSQGQWEEAERLEVQVLETRKTKLSEDHPDILSSMANLASTYWTQGRWEEAEQLFVQVVETRKRKLSEDHPDTLSSMANLASTYCNQGRWEEAEQLFVQVVDTRKKKLGEDHPDTLLSMANLASTYSSQGRWEEAERLEVQVMKMSKMKLGKDHPNTLLSMANLALTYWKEGRWKEAERLEVQVMEMSMMKLGQDHPDTLSSMANLASTYCSQGQLEEAERLEVQVMEARKTKLGQDHPDTLSSMANLAFIWKSCGYDGKAITLLRDCLVKRRVKFGPIHPSTLSTSRTLRAWETDKLLTN